jgi:NTE family protein
MNFDVVGMKIRIYAGLSLEAGNAYLADDPVKWNTMLKSWAVFVGADTFIGPAILAYGRADNGSGRVYFAIGDTF